MSLDVPQIEKALLLGTWNEDIGPGDDPIVQLIASVAQGNFRAPLTSPQASAVFQIRAHVGATPDGDRPLDDLLDLAALPSSINDELVRLALAVACLQAFVQANWTGPDLDVAPLDVLLLPGTTEAALARRAVAELAMGGEPAYHLARVPVFLRLAQILLTPPIVHCASAAWWRLRTARIHQELLDEPVALPDSLFAPLDNLATTFAADPVLSGRLLLERGLLEHDLTHDRAAGELFVRAARATGLEYELTGALGKRTKFQQTELSQLVLLAESRLPDDSHAFAGGVAPPPAPTPETLALNDDTLLEKTEFTSSSSGTRLDHLDPSAQPPLHPLDQCILLALCLNVRNTSPAHGLTSEQMAPYVERVVSHPRNWSVHTMALLLRARLESGRTRTVERATLQLQALVEQMPSADAPVSERLRLLHALPLPSRWEMERELARRFLALGVVRSALEIFERLEMWEEAVQCWGALEHADKGIAIVRDLLEGRRDEAEAVAARGKATSEARREQLDTARAAKLWCLLGDLEPAHAAEHYGRAWEVSKGTSSRAMRALGGYHFARGENAEAVACLRRAVKINPLLARTWFILGCACMREEDWAGAREAFARCVAIDDEDGESWSNLASVYLRLGEGDEGGVPFAHKMLAFRALKQGLRFSYDNWRMWSNYMLVAVDVGELAEAARALGRVVEETSAARGAESVDEDVLDRLVDAATRAEDDEEGAALSRTVRDVLQRTVLPRVASARIFRAYARLLVREERWADALQASLDAYRCGAGAPDAVPADVAAWRASVGEVEDAVDALRNFGPRAGVRWTLQARSVVRTFMGRARDFEDEPEWTRLVALLDELRVGE